MVFIPYLWVLFASWACFAQDQTQQAMIRLCEKGQLPVVTQGWKSVRSGEGYGFCMTGVCRDNPYQISHKLCFIQSEFPNTFNIQHEKKNQLRPT